MTQPPPGWAPPPLPTSFFTQFAPPPPAAAPQWAPPQPPAMPVPPARPPRRWIVVVVVAIVVVGLVAALVVLWTRGVLPGSPSVSPVPSVAVPTTPVRVESGDVGRAIELRMDGGTANVTVTGAEWTSSGELAPVPGTAYLVVDVTFTGVSGELAVGPVMTVAEGADKQRYPVSYGPSMPDLPPGALLRPGDTVEGSLGFMLPPGTVRLLFLGPDGEPMGSAEVPGP